MYFLFIIYILLFYYSQMSCYCKGNQLIRFCVCCQKYPCTQNQSHNGAQLAPKQADLVIQDIEQNFASLLEKELRSLSQRKQQEIGDLLETVSRLKTEVQRLENRNRLDRENESRLKDEVRKLTNRIRQLEDLVNRPARIEKKQVILYQTKHALAPKIETQPLENPQFEQLKDKLIKLSAQKLTLEEMNKNLDDRLKRLSSEYERIVNELNKRINELEGELQNKNEVIARVQNQITQLQQKYAILSKPSKYQPDPIIIHKVTNLPAEIHTIYVDRPIEKTKIVEVQKIVTKFVQPSRPIVNRIIQCGPSKNCKCDQPESQNQNNQNMEILTEKMQNLEQEYKNVINSYKGQRQKLVKTIENRDSDYRLLQKKVQLMEKISSKSNVNKCSHPDRVQVTVLKHENRQGSEPSEKPKNTKEVNNPTRTEQKTRKK